MDSSRSEAQDLVYGLIIYDDQWESKRGPHIDKQIFVCDCHVLKRKNPHSRAELLPVKVDHDTKCLECGHYAFKQQLTVIERNKEKIKNVQKR